MHVCIFGDPGVPGRGAKQGDVLAVEIRTLFASEVARLLPVHHRALFDVAASEPEPRPGAVLAAVCGRRTVALPAGHLNSTTARPKKNELAFFNLFTIPLFL